MNAIKSIGKKFARYIVGQNQESFEAQLKECINIDWFKGRAFGENADGVNEVILKRYEPIDTFFDDFDADFSCINWLYAWTLNRSVTFKAGAL